jgi:Rod binding domain-containing protein
MNSLRVPPASSAPALKTQKTERQAVDPRIVEAAQGLEAVFAHEMLRAMRNTIEKSDLSLDNSASDIYQGMLDQEYSEVASRTNSLGLAQQIIDYLTRDTYTKPRGNTSSDARTGGTHASESKLSSERTGERNSIREEDG